jgi:hypothetical protein
VVTIGQTGLAICPPIGFDYKYLWGGRLLHVQGHGLKGYTGLKKNPEPTRGSRGSGGSGVQEAQESRGDEGSVNLLCRLTPIGYACLSIRPDFKERAFQPQPECRW